jgi:hypothetical protein
LVCSIDLFIDESGVSNRHSTSLAVLGSAPSGISAVLLGALAYAENATCLLFDFFFLFCCCLRLARPIGLSLAFHQFCCTSIWGLRFRSSTKLSFAFFLARSYLSWSDLIMHIKSPLVAFGIVLVLLSQASALYPEDSNILTELYKFYKAYSPSYVLGWSIPPTCSWTGVTCDGSNDRVTGSSTMALL